MKRGKGDRDREPDLLDTMTRRYLLPNGKNPLTAASSRVRENTQIFTHTNTTSHVGNDLLQSQGCFAIRKEISVTLY